MKFKKVLVLSPHTDDQTLGCGGFLSKIKQEQGQTRVCLFSHGGAGIKFVDNEYKKYSNEQRLNNFRQATNILGVSKIYFFTNPEQQDVYHHRFDKVDRLQLIKFIQKSILDFQPDCLLIPNETYDQDHQFINKAAKAAIRAHFYSGAVLQYSTGNDNLESNFYVSLTQKQVETKLQAFSKYQSQNLKDHFYSLENIKNFLRRNGLFINEKFAESYKILRVKY